MVPLIIDCDPGVDDAIALLMAMARGDRFHLLGITAVAGNVPLPYTVRNALKICALAGNFQVPVYAGCPRPLLQPLFTAADVHGATGLRGAELPAPQAAPQPSHAVSFLIDTLTQAAQPVTVAALGPLTNLAVALVQAPQIAQHIERLVVMGGAVGQGNVTPAAEFNMYVDPHAARIVFEADIPTTLITLDTTHQVLTTPKRLAAIRQFGGDVALAAADLLAHYGRSDVERYGMEGAPLHDPCVVAYLLQPELFSLRPTTVTVDIVSPDNMGRTVVDWWHRTGAVANVEIAAAVDASGVYDLVLDALSRF